MSCSSSFYGKELQPYCCERSPVLTSLGKKSINGTDIGNESDLSPERVANSDEKRMEAVVIVVEDDVG